MFFEPQRQTIIDMAVLGADAELIAYALRKKGIPAKPEHVLADLRELEEDIRLEKDLRALRARQTAADIIVRLEALIPQLQTILEKAQKSKHTKSSIEAVKETSAVLSKIYELLIELKREEAFAKVSSYLKPEDVHKFVREHLTEIISTLPPEELKVAIKDAGVEAYLRE